jgi:hypothetical protein
MSREDIEFDMDIDLNTLDRFPRQNEFCYPINNDFAIGNKVKFRFGNQKYNENFIHGKITKIGSFIHEVISESGLTYFVWKDKLINEGNYMFSEKQKKN